MMKKETTQKDLKKCMKKTSTKGQLYIVGTPIGNLGDITLRALETLKAVDMILAEDTRQTLKLLNHYNIKKPLISYHKFNEIEKIKDIIKMLDEGKNLAIVSDAGMPRVSDPGKILIMNLIQNGYKINVVPGVTALVTAIVLSLIDTDTFVFEGFLPVRKSRKKERLKDLALETKSIVFYEAPHKLLQTLKDLKEVVGNRRITILRELTKIHEEILESCIEDQIKSIEANGIKGEIVLIVEGLDKSIKESKLIKIESENKYTDKELVDKYIKQGLSKNDSIKKVANIRKKPKNEVYMGYINEKNR